MQRVSRVFVNHMLGVYTLRFDDNNGGKHTIANGVGCDSVMQVRSVLSTELAVFETMRSYFSSSGTVVFSFDEHLERLRISAGLMSLPMPTIDLIASEVSEVAVGDRSIRVVLGNDGCRLVESLPFDFTRVGRPVSLGIFEVDDAPDFPSTAKHSCRSAWTDSARHQGVDEVLLVSSKGEILEANNSNVFAVVDGKLVTPPLDGRQLKGVTRQRVIELAISLGIHVQERPILLSDPFYELFLTSSLKEVAPVSSLCGQTMKSGAVTSTLQESFSTLYI